MMASKSKTLAPVRQATASKSVNQLSLMVCLEHFATASVAQVEKMALMGEMNRGLFISLPPAQLAEGRRGVLSP